MLLADAIGPALLVVLDTLAPAERLAFVLHDMFGVPFDEIAPIVDRSPDRHPPAGQPGPPPGARRCPRRCEPTSRQRREVVDRVPGRLAGRGLRGPARAARSGRRAALGRRRGSFGSAEELHGPDAVARVFVGRARAAELVLVDGVPGLMWAPGGRPRVVFAFTTTEAITAITVIADEHHLAQLTLAPLGSR